ncbi:hypothetical protein ACLGIH_20795 [Streptomyces sp. HMX87]|uniref:hypothetical protein n=1 Tax=Streptomyces sp. HMX87 TaxID=3390849 RepID=UPI003A859941
MGAGENKTVGAVVWLMLAIAALGVGGATAGEIGGALEREREFRAAPPCRSVPVEASGCLWEQKYTVRSADTNRMKRSEPPEAKLLLPSGEPWEVTFRDTGPVVSELEPGDEVVGIVWHGQVVELRAEGLRQQTSAGPVNWGADRLGGALACFSFGATALVGAVWALVARRNRRHRAAATVVRWHGVALAVVAIMALWAQAGNDWPMWSLPVIWGSFAVLLLASMTAFVIAALRGDLTGAIASAPRTPPPAKGPPGPAPRVHE